MSGGRLTPRGARIRHEFIIGRVELDKLQGTELWSETVRKVARELSADLVLGLQYVGPGTKFRLLGSHGLKDSLPWEEQLPLPLIFPSYERGEPRLLPEQSGLFAPLLDEEQGLGLLYASVEGELGPSQLERLVALARELASSLPSQKKRASSPGSRVRERLKARKDKEEGSGRFSTRLLKFSTRARRGIVGGRYQIEEEMMECRFSTLLRAQDRVSGNPTVLRKLQLPASDQTRLREARLQILREGRLLARLNHQNLPKVLEVIEDGEEMHLVLEEMAGVPLDQFAGDYGEPLAAEFVRRLMNQFLSVVEYLHCQDPPIIHRDLRPSSVLLSEHGTLKIAEFGLAKMGEAESVPSERTAFRSQGSPAYAPPEQLLGEPSRPENDFYSVGAILYFLATGVEPLPSSERCFRTDEMAPVSKLRPDFPKNLCQTIAKLMEPQAENRPGSAAEIRQLMNDEVELFEEEMILPQELVQLEEPETFESGLQEETTGHKSGEKKFSMWQVLFGRKAAKKAPSPEDEVVIDFEVEYRETFEEEDISEFPINREAGRLLPETLCKAAGAVCLAQISESELKVAVKEPDVHLYDNICIATKGRYRASLVRADGLLIDHAVEFIFDCEHIAESTTWMQYLEQKRFEEEKLVLTSAQAESFKEDIEGPVVEAVDRLIKEAIATEASDIHLEPFSNRMDLRYRVDGVLHQINAFDREQATSMVKRVKVMANMDIAQERVPQGGRISLRVGESDFDLRVSILPVPSGESCVMRVLKKGAFNLRLPDLGFDPTKEEKYRNILSQPYGLILVCGPTGSGKSTTLYASLKEIQRPDRKLITAEDPIEYQMPGITQVQMNTAPRDEEKRVTFARALREFLRHDPDVVLVGEIRDPETADISIQAALTGHLLLSTIHTNDAIGIVARLRDMGCESFLVGSTLLGGLGQRLARRICGDCREETEVPDGVRRTFAEHGIEEPKMFRGTGCKTCNHTGYQGRIALYELLEITPELRDLITSTATEAVLKEAAIASGYEPLLVDGLRKVKRGLVTLEEVQRVCKTL